ncbi:thioesterase PaaI family protein [Pleurotus pulmonarius]
MRKAATENTEGGSQKRIINPVDRRDRDDMLGLLYITERFFNKRQLGLDYKTNGEGFPSNVDVRKIKGNLPDAQKQLAANALAYFISTGNTWGADVGQRLNLVEVNILSREGGTQEAQTILEIDVTEEMCNLFGIMHGACAAYLFDPATSSALVALGLVLGIDGSGVSQSMNIIWHKPARRGAKLRLISNSIAIQGRIRSARCEIRDAEGLCVSATHSTINPGRKFKHGGKL